MSQDESKTATKSRGGKVKQEHKHPTLVISATGKRRWERCPSP